ncbi:MAG: hypothetical protein Q8N99_02515 [Nanoarchaeota archaeon]|nr:hypothetical protein [Nanoarchaeota archaeon]
MADYDILGNIAIIKGEKKAKKQKLEEAKELLKRPGIKTVLEKGTNVKGRLRTIKPIHLKGERNLIALHKENNCTFKFNVSSCYFSPRLSNERQNLAKKIKNTDKVLVMFAGVGAYPIVIYNYSRPEKIVGVEIGRECCKYFKENLRINKVIEGKIDIIQGDVKKKINKDFIKKYGEFDIVIMARPNLKDSFIEQGLLACKKGGTIIYYGFCKDEDIKEMIQNLEREIETFNRQVDVKYYCPAGEIAPYKHRYRIEMEILK